MEIIDGDRCCEVRGSRVPAVLAALASHRGQVVPADVLIDTVWDGVPPATARSQIHICVSRVRRMLGQAGRADALRTRTGGYVLRLEPGEVDASRFDQLVAESRRQADRGETDHAIRLLREADLLWFGETLAGVPGELVARWRRSLDEKRLAALEERIRLEAAAGRNEHLVGELESLVQAYPLRERLHASLVLALYRSGRQVEALDAVRRTRAHFAKELGLELSAELASLERAVLSHDPALDPPATVASAASADHTPARATSAAERGRVATPRQLPSDIADFTGREKLIDAVRELLLTAAEDRPPVHSASLVAISGLAGIGKTSLAVRVAHEVAEHFPEGQLYANLRGGSASPERPIEVLARLLRTLGVPGTAIPDDRQERISLFRSLLAERRMLVLLDDAADENQVMALLPNTPSCAVIVTSRARLTALPGCHQVDVDVLSDAQSLDLLHRVVGERIAAESAAAVELVRLCGNLPLALRIAGARLASRPHWQVARLVDRLRGKRPLDELVHRDLCVREAFRLSHDVLSAGGRRLLRRLSVLDGDDFPGWVAMPLLDDRTSDAEELLEHLVDVRLLEAQAGRDPGSVRYRLHDLVRVFAREKLMVEESAEARREVVRRLLGAWLALVEQAHRYEYGGDYTVLHGHAARWKVPSEVSDALLDRPVEWLELERRNLVAAVRQADRYHFDEYCWDLAATLVTLFENRSYYDDWTMTADLALAATRRNGNRRGEAVTLHSLGALHMFQRRLPEARQNFSAALRIFMDLRDAHAIALVQRNLGSLDRLRGDYATALERYANALAGLRAAGDRVGEAHVLANIAGVRVAQGVTAVAQALLEQALDICQATGVRRVEAQVLHRLGELYLRMEDLDRAEESFRQALRIVQATSDRTGEAYALHGLGAVYRRAGQVTRSRSTLTRSKQIAVQVRERTVEAHTLYELSQLPGSDPAEAAGQLRQAAEIFAFLQARMWHSAALRALAEIEADIR